MTPLRDAPEHCDVGEGILHSQVFTLEPFSAGHQTVEFFPADSGEWHPLEGVPDDSFSIVTPPISWIFQSREFSHQDGRTEIGWLRTA